jgi:hypothetical protein
MNIFTYDMGHKLMQSVLCNIFELGALEQTNILLHTDFLKTDFTVFLQM